MRATKPKSKTAHSLFRQGLIRQCPACAHQEQQGWSVALSVPARAAPSSSTARLREQQRIRHSISAHTKNSKVFGTIFVRHTCEPPSRRARLRTACSGKGLYANALPARTKNSKVGHSTFCASTCGAIKWHHSKAAWTSAHTSIPQLTCVSSDISPRPLCLSLVANPGGGWR